MFPGWHTYWKYPGDAGIPTEIKWKLPPGWKVGEIQWPIPLKLKEPGDIQIYGYHDEVLLMQEITPPASIADSAVKLSAEASWLVCEKLCIPGSASLQLDLPGSTTNSPANSELFDRYRRLLPNDWPGPENVAESRVASQATMNSFSPSPARFWRIIRSPISFRLRREMSSSGMQKSNREWTRNHLSHSSRNDGQELIVSQWIACLWPGRKWERSLSLVNRWDIVGKRRPRLAPSSARPWHVSLFRFHRRVHLEPDAVRIAGDFAQDFRIRQTGRTRSTTNSSEAASLLWPASSPGSLGWPCC